MNQDILQAAIDQVMPTAVATGLFISVCSISAPTPASGAISGVYSPVSGLQNIPCIDAPETFSDTSLSVTELKALDQTASTALRHVLLDNYYDQLSPSSNWGDLGWRATVDGVDYDILGAENDSQQQMTRLKLRKVTT